MYFAIEPKQHRKDLFGFEYESLQLEKALRDEITHAIVVYGLRRTGKTSLIRTVLNENKINYIWIDGRTIESREDFFVQLKSQLESKHLLKIKEINIRGISISLSSTVDEYLRRMKNLVIVIDEVQELYSYRLDKYLAYVYDTFKVKLIFSGSEIGMLDKFLGRKNAKAPFFGRGFFDIRTKKLSENESMKFLIEGGRQAGLNLSEEAEKVVGELDGIIGWLTLYGYNRRQKEKGEAMNRTYEEASILIKQEIDNFLAIRTKKRYEYILKELSIRSRTWNELKYALIKKYKRISDSQVSGYLRQLEDYGFIEKEEEHYKIVDPILERIAREL